MHGFQPYVPTGVGRLDHESAWFKKNIPPHPIHGKSLKFQAGDGSLKFRGFIRRWQPAKTATYFVSHGRLFSPDFVDLLGKKLIRLPLTLASSDGYIKNYWNPWEWDELACDVIPEITFFCFWEEHMHICNSGNSKLQNARKMCLLELRRE